MSDDISLVKVNDIISFQSKAINDPNVYHGKVIAICGYDLAKSYGDIFAYNQNVKSVDQETPVVEECEFFIIKWLERDSFLEVQPTKPLEAFAKEWINLSTLFIVNVFLRLDITVYRASASHDGAAIISALNTAGYSAKIIKEY